MDSNVIAQGVGLIASALVIFAFSRKSDKLFKVFVMCGALVFSFHYILLGAYAGAAVAILNAVRTFFVIKFEQSRKVLFSFLFLYLVAGFIVYDKPSDLLPILSGSLSTIALCTLSGIKMRLMAFGIEILWLSYSIVIKSIGGLITNLFVLSTNAITIYRLTLDNKKQER